MSDFADVMGAVGMALSGLGSATGAVGGLAGDSKKAIRESAKQQKKLMEYQNKINRENLLEQRAYAEEQYDKHYSLSAQRREAEEAGYNPEVAIGASGGGASASAGPAPGVSIPGAPDIEPTGRYVGRTIGELGDSMMSGARFMNELQKLRDERTARRYQLKAQDLQNKALQVDLDQKSANLYRTLFDNKRLPILASQNDTRFRWQGAAEDRNREAHDFSMKVQSAEFDRNAIRFNREGLTFFQDFMQNELEYWLGRYDLDEKEWRRQYRERYGVLPEKSLSLGDFLGKLALDATNPETGFVSLNPGVIVDAKGRHFTGPFRKPKQRLVDKLDSLDAAGVGGPWAAKGRDLVRRLMVDRLAAFEEENRRFYGHR